MPVRLVSSAPVHCLPFLPISHSLTVLFTVQCQCTARSTSACSAKPLSSMFCRALFSVVLLCCSVRLIPSHTALIRSRPAFSVFAVISPPFSISSLSGALRGPGSNRHCFGEHSDLDSLIPPRVRHKVVAEIV